MDGIAVRGTVSQQCAAAVPGPAWAAVELTQDAKAAADETAWREGGR